MLLGCTGGPIRGKVGASFLPFLKVPIAAGVTFGAGKAAKAYFESDMTMDIKEKFLEGEREARKHGKPKIPASNGGEISDEPPGQ